MIYGAFLLILIYGITSNLIYLREMGVFVLFCRYAIREVQQFCFHKLTADIDNIVDNIS